ncbi:MAG: photosynthetic reaction center cytochrome PufC [Rubrivivax sp.]
MSIITRLGRSPLALLALAGTFLLAGCERPPVESVQHGYRGTGMVLVYNPRTVEKQIPLNQPPASTPPAPTEGPKAKDVFQNVKVLGDLSLAEFTRHMNAISQWIAPAEGCAYCHNLQNLADDSKYTKVVARRMIQMTQHINADWKTHVAGTGVTCYTCHRGNPVPQQVWFTPVPQDLKANFIGDRAGQNIAATNIGLTSLPEDPYTPFLKEDKPIRVTGSVHLPDNNPSSIKQAEFTYALMVHMTQSLGVNCTFCHNTHSFQTWDGAPPQRVTAWHGIRMVRDLNNAYLEGLTPTFPKTRLGPQGDVAKVFCATCHQGAYKPVYGAQMAKDYSGLMLAAAAPAVAALPAPTDEPRHSVLYFGVGSATLEGAQAKGLAQLIATMSATPKATAIISGYHSAAGELAANQELAKQRAFSVRDALLAAGIAEKRVTLEKPAQAGANISGEDPAARRVEVSLK